MAGRGDGGVAGAERRWRAAVTGMPLEAPRAFPASLLPLVRSLTGGTAATYTTGPATRRALRSAGARGATTRSTVHLPTDPARTDPGLLAHELSHARTPLGRPRFSLHAAGGAADTDERAARATEAAVRRAVTGDGVSGATTALPVGGAAAGAPALLEAAVHAAREAAHEIAHAAAREAVRDSSACPGAQHPPNPSQGRAGQAQTDSSPGGPIPGGPAAARNEAAPTAQTATGTGTPPRPPTLEELVRAVEERVLEQLERRGGRYPSAF